MGSGTTNFMAGNETSHNPKKAVVYGIMCDHEGPVQVEQANILILNKRENNHLIMLNVKHSHYMFGSMINKQKTKNALQNGRIKHLINFEKNKTCIE